MVIRSRTLVAIALGLWSTSVIWNYASFDWVDLVRAEYKFKPVVLPAPGTVRLLSIGFPAVIADLYWIAATHYFGEPRYRSDNYSQLHEYIDIVNEIAPDFKEPYVFGGMAIPWNTGKEWVNVPWSVAILRRGAARFPDDWRLNFYLAFDLATYMGDFEAAGRALEEAAKLPAAPPYLRSLAMRYIAKGGELDRAQEMIQDMLDGATDDNTKLVMASHLEELQVERDLEALEGALKQYREEHGGKAPATAADPEFGAILRRPFEGFLDPNKDQYLYDSATGTFSSKTLERFSPHGLKK